MIIKNPEFWNGCLRSGRLGAPAARDADRPDVPLKNWIEYCVPSYNQRGDSCVGEGWANWLEPILRCYVGRDAIPVGYQIDGYKVYFKAKEMFDGGCLAGGLQIPQGFDAMKALGWIPQDSILVEIADDWVSQGEALLETPLVVGHLVYPGWFYPNVENGCIDHVWTPSAKGNMGHCTVRVGRHVQNNKKLYSGENSWGDGYAWNGIFLMEEEMSRDTSLSCPYTISIPGGFERLAKHDGWKQGLITTPYDTQSIQL